MSKDNSIEMIQRNGVFVPVNDKTKIRESRAVKRKPTNRPVNDLQPIGEIIDGMVIDFFKLIRKEMFRR